MPRIALAMIVKGTDAEALLLRRCLENVSPYVDGIFITRTQPNNAVANVASEFKAHLSDFVWCDDFAAARNFNFSQVPNDYDYIMWTDADDVWRGLEKLKPTIKEHASIDAFGFWYYYDWDEAKKPIVVHRKTMIVKNDGTARWVGTLHEDIDPARQYETMLVDGIERLHLSTKERHSENAQRNVAIAAKQLSQEPDDPRSYWNLANSQFGIADYAAARATFDEFIKRTESDEERYLAQVRLADIAKAQGDKNAAVRSLQLAIGIYPSLPDAYLQLAYLFYSFGDMDKAEEYCIQGMMRKPLINKMIVFNPRDYDYNPMMLLAQVYYHKNRPDLMLPLLEGCLKIYPKDKHLKQLVKDGIEEKKKLGKALMAVQRLQKITDKEKLRKAIDKLPVDVKSHPAVSVLRNTHFVKTESSGRDLVIYCGPTSHQWNPELFKEKGFGGSEEAVVNLAREWARLGWNVTVYNNCGHKPVTDENVTYRPYWEWNYRDKQDVVILWRWTKPLDFPINAPKIFVDLHDVIPSGEFTEKRLQRVTKVFVKTQFHRSLFPSIPDHKIAVVPNGFNIYADQSIKKDPYLVINTSSPDRSMDVLPKLWKEVKKRVPQARMQWAYGWDVYQASNSRNQKMMTWMEETQKAIDDAGIESLGKLPQHEVGKLYQKAAILAYPTEFAEIDCISVKKAQAARCIPITTDFGALDESMKYGVKIHSTKTKDTWNKPYQFHFGLEDEDAQKAWVEAVVAHLLKGPEKNLDTSKWAEQFEWPRIAKRWEQHFV